MSWPCKFAKRALSRQINEPSLKLVNGARNLASLASKNPTSIPDFLVSSLDSAENVEHVRQISHQLSTRGVLKLRLQFPDEKSIYLQNLIQSLNTYHNHLLPSSHSATRGWFWDVRPLPAEGDRKLARSETNQEFQWHTDCSYEDCPPRYFGLHVLHADELGGGTLSVVPVQQLVEKLSDATRSALMKPAFEIRVPGEFVKQESKKHIRCGLLGRDPRDGSFVMRLREDIITPIGREAHHALEELNQMLISEAMDSQAIQLSPKDLPTGSIVLMDNRLWLHSRSEIKDPKRHLRRVRWNAIPFP